MNILLYCKRRCKYATTSLNSKHAAVVFRSFTKFSKAELRMFIEYSLKSPQVIVESVNMLKQ